MVSDCIEHGVRQCAQLVVMEYSIGLCMCWCPVKHVPCYAVPLPGRNHCIPSCTNTKWHRRNTADHGCHQVRVISVLYDFVGCF